MTKNTVLFAIIGIVAVIGMYFIIQMGSEEQYYVEEYYEEELKTEGNQLTGLFSFDFSRGDPIGQMVAAKPVVSKPFTRFSRKPMTRLTTLKKSSSSNAFLSRITKGGSTLSTSTSSSGISSKLRSNIEKYSTKTPIIPKSVTIDPKIRAIQAKIEATAVDKKQEILKEKIASKFSNDMAKFGEPVYIIDTDLKKFNAEAEIETKNLVKNQIETEVQAEVLKEKIKTLFNDDLEKLGDTKVLNDIDLKKLNVEASIQTELILERLKIEESLTTGSEESAKTNVVQTNRKSEFGSTSGSLEATYYAKSSPEFGQTVYSDPERNGFTPSRDNIRNLTGCWEKDIGDGIDGLGGCFDYNRMRGYLGSTNKCDADNLIVMGCMSGGVTCGPVDYLIAPNGYECDSSLGYFVPKLTGTAGGTGNQNDWGSGDDFIPHAECSRDGSQSIFYYKDPRSDDFSDFDRDISYCGTAGCDPTFGECITSYSQKSLDTGTASNPYEGFDWDKIGCDNPTFVCREVNFFYWYLDRVYVECDGKLDYTFKCYNSQCINVGGSAQCLYNEIPERNPAPPVDDGSDRVTSIQFGGVYDPDQDGDGDLNYRETFSGTIVWGSTQALSDFYDLDDDIDNDGVLNWNDIDPDGDGLRGSNDNAPFIYYIGLFEDLDGSGVADWLYEDLKIPDQDANGNGVADILETDEDGNGIADFFEDGSAVSEEVEDPVAKESCIVTSESVIGGNERKSTCTAKYFDNNGELQTETKTEGCEAFTGLKEVYSCNANKRCELQKAFDCSQLTPSGQVCSGGECILISLVELNGACIKSEDCASGLCLGEDKDKDGFYVEGTGTCFPSNVKPDCNDDAKEINPGVGVITGPRCNYGDTEIDYDCSGEPDECETCLSDNRCGTTNVPTSVEKTKILDATIAVDIEQVDFVETFELFVLYEEFLLRHKIIDGNIIARDIRKCTGNICDNVPEYVPGFTMTS